VDAQLYARYGDPMSKVGRRIRELRKSLQCDQGAFAIFFGVNQSTISRWESGEDTPSALHVNKLAEMAQVNVQYFIEGVSDVPQEFESTIGAKIVGTVAAGQWLETVEWHPDDQYNIYLPIGRGLESLEIKGFLVQGASMNKVYPPGSIVFATPTIANEFQPRDGQRVLVQRKNRSGEYEITVKEFRIEEDGSGWLWPNSDDPYHQSPIMDIVDEEEGIEDVVITGVIVAAFIYENWE